METKSGTDRLTGTLTGLQWMIYECVSFLIGYSREIPLTLQIAPSRSSWAFLPLAELLHQPRPRRKPPETCPLVGQKRESLELNDPFEGIAIEVGTPEGVEEQSSPMND